jgi:hypothetical protein
MELITESEILGISTGIAAGCLFLVDFLDVVETRVEVLCIENG